MKKNQINLLIQKWLPCLCAVLFGVSPLMARTSQDEGPVTFSEFLLTGEAVKGGMEFSLTGKAHVPGRRGGELKLLSGSVAITGIPEKARYKVGQEGDAYHLKFTSRGTFPVDFRFKAKVDEAEGWKSVAFQVLSSPLRKVQVKGLPLDVKLDIADAGTREPCLYQLPLGGRGFSHALESGGARKGKQVVLLCRSDFRGFRRRRPSPSETSSSPERDAG